MVIRNQSSDGDPGRGRGNLLLLLSLISGISYSIIRCPLFGQFSLAKYWIGKCLVPFHPIEGRYDDVEYDLARVLENDDVYSFSKVYNMHKTNNQCFFFSWLLTLHFPNICKQIGALYAGWKTSPMMWYWSIVIVPPLLLDFLVGNIFLVNVVKECIILKTVILIIGAWLFKCIYKYVRVHTTTVE